MANDSGTNWVHIAVAVITVAGGIAVAIISKDAYTKKETTIPGAETLRTAEAKPEVAARSSMAITGVLIGKTGNEPFVSDVITQFSPKEEVAITVHYMASEEVSNFPVRLSARVASGFSNGVEEQIADVSKPGNSFWTFRFKPKDGWIGSQHFVWISINDHEAYSQQFDVSEK